MTPGTSPALAAQASPTLSVMLVDDEAMTLAMLGRVLEKENCEVFPATNLREASSILSETTPDVAIVDVYLGEEDGLAYARELRRRMPEMGIIVISSDDTAKLATIALESGADNFLSKPIAPSALALAARKQGELRRERQRAVEFKRELGRAARESVFPQIITQCDTMRAALRLVEKVAPRDLAALVYGESGTGKELVARAIHEISPRAGGEFVEVNCGALPPNLVESELFGHEKGAFTGAIASRPGKLEQASGGTLFLDEIGELPLEVQPKLLRALQEKRVARLGGRHPVDCDFRLVCATNRDLVEEVREERFREDLFYRVSVFPIRLPPLRQRPEDMDLLLAAFLREEGVKSPNITEDARRMLRAHAWPGNVRELKNFAQAASVLAEDIGSINAELVASYFGGRLQGSLLALESSSRSPSGNGPIRKLEDLEREEVGRALRFHEGNVPEAARALGMGRATLYKYIKRKNIDPATGEDLPGDPLADESAG